MKSDESNPRESQQFLDNNSNSLKLSQIIAAGAWFIGLAYVIGRNFSNAYYSSLGVHWIVPILTTDQIIRAGIHSMIGFFLALAIGYMFISEKYIGEITVRRINNISFCLLVGCQILLAALIFLDFPTSNHILILSGFAFTFGSGFLAAEFFSKYFRKKKSEIQRNHLYYFALLCLFFSIPYSLGDAQGRLDSDPSTSGLACILIPEIDSTCTWRLVTMENGKMVIARLSKNMNERAFKIVDPDAKWIIGAVTANPFNGSHK